MQKTALLLVITMFIIPMVSFSHPHLFIETKVTIIFDEDGIAGIHSRWIFDEMYSAMLIKDYDSNKNGKLDKQEIESLRLGAFENIKKYEYFSYIKIDNKKYQVEKIEKFFAEIFLNKICYEFFIPCNITAKKTDRIVRISMYDITYYANMEFSKRKPVKFRNNSLKEYDYKWSMTRDVESYYYGQVSPETIVIKFRRK